MFVSKRTLLCALLASPLVVRVSGNNTALRGDRRILTLGKKGVGITRRACRVSGCEGVRNIAVLCWFKGLKAWHLRLVEGKC